MIKRSTWIVLGIFIVLVAIAILWQRSPETFVAPTATPTSYPTLLPTLGEGVVNQIEISGSGRAGLVLKPGQDGQWQFSTLDSARVDQGKVEELLSTIRSATVISVTEAGVDPQIIGLANPTLLLRLHTVEGKIISIKIGDKTPTGSGYYVQIDEEAPVVLRTIAVESVMDLSEKDSLTETSTTSEPFPSQAP